MNGGGLHTRPVMTVDLTPGDQVALPSGLVRTVASVVATGEVGFTNRPLYSVRYVEGRTAEWSAGNSGADTSVWLVITDSEGDPDPLG